MNRGVYCKWELTRAAMSIPMGTGTDPHIRAGLTKETLTLNTMRAEPSRLGYQRDFKNEQGLARIFYNDGTHS